MRTLREIAEIEFTKLTQSGHCTLLPYSSACNRVETYGNPNGVKDIIHNYFLGDFCLY